MQLVGHDGHEVYELDGNEIISDEFSAEET